MLMSNCPFYSRSKRGCNGGKPCEQCVRRGQSCNYSQRRKSGPRGRPAVKQEQQQQQQAVSTSSTAAPNGPARRPVGTRMSSRRRTMKRPSTSSPSSSSPPLVEHKAKVESYPAAAASSPSPSRTASISSNSSSSSPPSESSSSSSDDGKEEEEGALSDTSSSCSEEEQKKKKLDRKLHVHKRSKISRPPCTEVSAPTASPPPAVVAVPAAKGNDHSAASPTLVAGNKTERREGPSAPAPPAAAAIAAAAAATAAAVAAAKDDVPTPQDEEMLLKLTASLSSSSSSSSSASASASPSSSSSSPPQSPRTPLLLAEAGSYVSKNKIMITTAKKTVPPRQHSPLTVGAPALSVHLQRSSSLSTWARETSTDAQQQRQPQKQVHRSSASVGAVPTSSSNISARIGEITMQPLEIASSSSSSSRPPTDTTITDRARSVFVHMAMQQQQQQHQRQRQAQAHQAPPFAVARVRNLASNHPVQQQQSLPPADPMDVSPEHTAAAATMILDVVDFGAEGALKDLEEDELGRCPWQIPSLTREMSLARVVAALGGEQSASSHGVGLEGSSVNSW